jgi:hypothetical protein
MSGSRLRRIAHLETLTDRVVERLQQDRLTMMKQHRDLAFVRIANISLLVMHGDPKNDEPLVEAWKRCCEALEPLRQRHPQFADWGHGTPFIDYAAKLIALDFRRLLLPSLPGHDEAEKLSRLLERAPLWLLWFTHADLAGEFLGLNLPDLSRMQKFERSGWTLGYLPEGPFQLRRLPVDHRGSSWRKKVKHERPKLLDNLTPHQRRRLARVARVLNDDDVRFKPTQTLRKPKKQRAYSLEELEAEMRRRGLPILTPPPKRLNRRADGDDDVRSEDLARTANIWDRPAHSGG